MEYYQLNLSVSKALNAMETQLKSKHARSIIISTHRTRECRSFWTAVSSIPLMEHRFTAWKFCHLLHKVLREGHSSAIKHSQSHKKMLLEMGKLWSHLQDGVGSCIHAYSRLLVTKLDFHEKNCIVPGNLQIAFRDIENFAGDDINIYFELGVEIFDYLDEIMNVQMSIFSSIDTYRMSSMTPQGQCRLAPLVTLIQDLNPLYDLCVRIMFKLHDNLPNDVLSGHRVRFRELFSKIKTFYGRVRPLQYFANLIQVPSLPENAPNFTSKVDFGNYIPPVVTIPEPEPEPEPLDDLVDLTVANESQPLAVSEQANQHATQMEQLNAAKDILLEKLQSEIDTLRRACSSMDEIHRQEVNEMRDEKTKLQLELKSAHEKCLNMQLAKDELETQLANTPELIQKATETEEKVKISEGKFVKLKTMYTELREEHINLLRRNGETNKLLSKENVLSLELKAENALLAKEISEIRQAVDENNELRKLVEDKSVANQALENKCEELKQKIENSKTSENSVKTEMTDIMARLKVSCGQVEELQGKVTRLEKSLSEAHADFSKKSVDLNETIAKLNSNLNEKNAFVEELQKDHVGAIGKAIADADEIQEKFLSLTAAFEEKQLTCDHQFHEIASMKTQLQELHQQNTALEAKVNELKANASDLERVLDETNVDKLEKLTALTAEFEGKKATCEQQSNEILSLKTKLEEQHHRNNDLELKCEEAREGTQRALAEKNACNIEKREEILANLVTVFGTAQKMIHSNFNMENGQHFERSFKILEQVERVLSLLKVSYCKYLDEGKSADLVETVLFLCYHLLTLRELCLVVYNTSTDVEKGQAVFDKIFSLAAPAEEICTKLQKMDLSESVGRNADLLQSMLKELEHLLRELTNTRNLNEELGDVIENELAEMEKVIAEATEKFVLMLSRTKNNDEGIKLEVNEKILDACTNLMECVQRLIKKSKVLQDEIVSSGRGRVSAKEFYKRNSEWTEGLISASKSVAKGANLLVDAANKAVVSESNYNFEIIVAAQEIAACTAQLVISSKVKAPKESDKLQDLSKASRMVSQATGAVVAIVKDCNQRLENYVDVDLSKLTASQAKTMEMDIHVKVLELEQALQMERLKLAAFRRNLYKNTEN